MLHADDFSAKEADEADGTAEFEYDIIFAEALLDKPTLLELVAVLEDVIFHQLGETADVQLHAVKRGTLFGRQRELEVPASKEVLDEIWIGECHMFKRRERVR
jgi:hypothetical protein